MTDQWPDWYKKLQARRAHELAQAARDFETQNILTSADLRGYPIVEAAAPTLTDRGDRHDPDDAIARAVNAGHV